MFLEKIKKFISSLTSKSESIAVQTAFLVVPLLLCIVLYICVHLVTAQQIQTEGELTVENFRTRAYGIIREMQIVSDSLINDKEFSAAINADSEADFDPIELCDTIKSHVERSPYVSNAYFISKSLNTVYTDNGYYMYDGLRLILKRLVANDDTDYEPDISNGWHILNANYAPPYYVVTIPAENGLDSTTLIVTLDTREFLRAMYEERASLCCIYNENFSLSTLLLHYPALDWNSPEQISAVLGFDVRCFYIETDEFTYLSAIPTHDFYAPERTIIYVFAVYAIVLVLVGLLYIFLAKRQRYNAVSSLIDTLPRSSPEKPSYEELLQTIQLRLREYQDRSRAEAKRIERDNLQHILMGTYANRPSAEQLRSAGLPTESEGYYLAVIHINDSPSLVKDGPKVLSIGMTCHIFCEALKYDDDKLYSMAVTAFDHNYFAVFSLHDSSISIELIREIIDSKVKFIEEEYGFGLRVSVSSYIPDMSALPSAYKETSSLNGFIKFVDSNAMLVTQDDMRNSIGILLNGDFIKQIQILSNTLEIQEFDIVPAMVDAILEHHVAKLRKHYALAQNRILTVATILAEALISYQIDEDFKNEAVALFGSADSISTVSKVAHSVFKRLAEGSVAEVKADVVNLAREYIGNNFSNPDLSIPDVCSHCGVSVQYLSRLFRERLGTTMLEYINQTRMESARELLLSTALSIGEISAQTGYNNTVTFSRNFKHYVNLSPTEFRNINKQK